ncbi:MAG: DUF3084 domain-containing protein [Akkermansiaceae bacterium]|nr:DUF3084 domain-containing protein [Armatimonadota bacterium]
MQVPLLILVLGVLIPVSGFIAWAGDRIGHQVGKRRHTLLGLRPRHTAMLFTVGSGIGISVVSFLVLWFASEGFRVILSQGVELLTINKSLRNKNERLVSEVTQRTRQAEAASADAENALKDRDIAQGLRDKATRQAETARKELGKARTNLQDARQNLQSAKAAFLATKNKLGTTAGRLESARTNLARAQGRLRTAQRRITVAEEAKTQSETEEQLAKTDTKKAEKRLREIETNSQRTIEKAGLYVKEQTEKVESQRLTFQAEVNRKQMELQGLQADVESLLARRDELTKELQASRSSATALRRGQITYRVGEEVGRISIASDQSVWRIESALERFWINTSKRAEDRGATASGSVGTRAVALSPRMAPTTVNTPGESGTAVNASLPSEDDAIRLLAQTIRLSDEPVAVVLVASANAVVGEPVLVDVKTYRNAVVLVGGIKLGETTINGGSSMTREEAADAVYDFLRNDVRKVLLKAGVIPTVGSEGESGSNVVNLTGGEWLRIMDDLKRADFRARIVVKTAKAHRAADPVTLSFEVKELPGIPPRLDLPNTGSIVRP